METKDLTGQKFGKLTVIEKTEPHVTPSGSRQICWNCLCDCGNPKYIKVTTNHLITGHTKSCGCLKSIATTEKNMKHGMAGSRIYDTYYHMRRRCFNNTDKEYHRYGGRGITVCDEWLGDEGFEHFYKWSMANGYKDNLTIDRINNDGNYEPGNCRWVTRTEQMNNVCYNVQISHNGETHTIAEWAKRLGIKQDTIQARLKYYHFSPEKALFKKPTCKKKTELFKNGVSIGVFDSQKECAEHIGVMISEISAYFAGKIKTVRGYTMKRIEQEALSYEHPIKGDHR